MNHEFWQVLRFTFTTALLTTFCILPFGILTAWILARWRWIGKSFLETLITLPLVLPPVAVGLFLLKLLGQRGPVGSFLSRWNWEVVFTWKAVVIATGVMAFPLLVKSSTVAFQEVDIRLEQIARTLGASSIRTFFTITFPLAFRGILAGILLAFIRALGEFGATIMIAGNIPGKTRTLSLAIYQAVILGKDNEAITMALTSLLLAFLAVIITHWFLPRSSTFGK